MTGRQRFDGGPRDPSPPPPPDPLPLPVVDSHCHLDLVTDDLMADAPALLDAARTAGVDRVVQVGIDLPSSRLAAQSASAYDGLLAAVAIHPNEAAAGVDEGLLAEIARLAALPRVRAVGETGLDHYRTGADRHAAQEASFRGHIEIAKTAGIALMIHDRDAHDDVLRVLREQGAPERTVFHCFSGGAAMARECATRGYLMSFAGNVTFSNAGALREAAAVVPLELLLVETDAPFLTPTPWRGRPNSPAMAALTVRALAEAKGVPLEAVCEAVSANAERAFGPW